MVPKSGTFILMTLEHYMALYGLDDEAMALIIGDVGATGVRKWRTRVRIPRPEQMKRIHDATNGEVQPNDFYDIIPLQEESLNVVKEEAA